MDLITHEILETLARPRKNVGISIYMPFNDGRDGDQKNPALLKDILDSARTELAKEGVKPDALEKLIEPGYQLIRDETFWRDRFEALAIFLFAGELLTYKLPFASEQRVAVSRYPYLKPLLRDYLTNKKLYVLVLESGGSRLFKFDKHNYLDITPKAIEKSSKEYADYFQIEREANYHLKRAGRGVTKEGLISHGHDNTEQLDKRRSTEYAHIIAKEIKKIANVEKLPLVLAGIKSGFLAPTFRSVYGVRDILNDYIEIETAPMNMQALRKGVDRIIEKLDKAEEDVNFEMVSNLLGTGYEENLPDQIVKRAFEGRVDTLFVNDEKDVFGVINVLNDTCEASVTDSPDDEDLTNIAIASTWDKKGKVFFVPDDMVQGRPLMASLRY